MTAAAVADTTLLSNFAHAGRPDLPRRAFPGLVVPAAVLEELREGERLGMLPRCDWSSLPVVEPEPPQVAAAANLEEVLDSGEIAAIAVALRLEAILVTDDRAARRSARSLGLEVTGTLGALSSLVDAAQLSLDEADRLLRKMLAKGYRSPVSSLRDLR